MAMLRLRQATLQAVTPAADSAVSVRNVSKTYQDVEALKNLSLEFPRGELTSLLGPSGCGKTTLLKIIAGLLQPNSGEVEVNGKTVTGPGPDRAFVFQDFALLPWANVIRNVAFGLELRGVAKSEREAHRREIHPRSRPRRVREEISASAFGRHAPARRPCARALGRCAGAAAGRALLGRGRADAPQVPGGSSGARRGTRRRPSSS